MMVYAHIKKHYIDNKKEFVVKCHSKKFTYIVERKYSYLKKVQFNLPNCRDFLGLLFLKLLQKCIFYHSKQNLFKKKQYRLPKKMLIVNMTFPKRFLIYAFPKNTLIELNFKAKKPTQHKWIKVNIIDIYRTHKN